MLSKADSEYCSNLERCLFPDTDIKKCKVLSLTEKPPKPRKTLWKNNLHVLYSRNRISSRKRTVKHRHIPQKPTRILDAPGLLDDYYLNLIDWSIQNVLCVALGKLVFLWNAENGSIQEINCTNENDQDQYVTSVSWMADGNYLAIGTSYNDVQIWEIEKLRKVRTLLGHNSRVASLSWNNHILSSGDLRGIIINSDVRVSNHITCTLQAHTQEVCGLKWSPDGTQLASGGNDNMLCIWDIEKHLKPRFTFNHHHAAVKAVAWCPWQKDILASGGGTTDRKMRFWNTNTGSCLNCIDTNSQVCSILWSKYHKELVSAHGFVHNQLVVWSYPSCTKLTELHGHTSRVLHLAHSPDGSTVVSAAGDETLRFWKIFNSPPKNTQKKKKISSPICSINIR